MRQPRTSIRVNPETLTAARRLAVASGRTLTELVAVQLGCLLDDIDAGLAIPSASPGGGAVVSLSHAARPQVERTRATAARLGVPWTLLLAAAVQRVATE